jgi:hypothetical protein
MARLRPLERFVDLFSPCSLIFKSKSIALVQELFALSKIGKVALKDDLVVVVSSRWLPLEL